MSQEVYFTETDYKNLISWFELSFGKNDKQTDSDRNTLTKINAMALSHLDELKEMHQGDRKEGDE
jgi:hypothetical protein